MDDDARLQLQKMIKANNVEDQTELIRNLKHSMILKNDVRQLILLKEKYPLDPQTVHLEGMTTCHFLFTYYTDIYNKVRKDEIDLNILFRFFEVLERIENGDLDQNEGAFLVGTLLKEIYIDSALKKADKLDKEHGTTEQKVVEEPLQISWKQFKHIGL